MKFQERLSIYIGTADQQSIKQRHENVSPKVKTKSVGQSVVNKDDIIDRSSVRD